MPYTIGMPWPVYPDDWQKGFGAAETTTSPIILDLDGNGVQTIRLNKGDKGDPTGPSIFFNLDAKGLSENTGWVDARDGLLVRDLNGDGQITSGRELFGNHTLLTQGPKAGQTAAHGFEALAELDTNGDGMVNSQDGGFASLRVWKDANGNGLTDAGELLTLAQAGVASLNVAFTNSEALPDAQGNTHKELGQYTSTSGATHSMSDVWFAVDSMRTRDTDPITVSAAIAALPNLAGMGNLRSLHQAMARDSSGKLQALVEQYVSLSADTSTATLDDLLYHWAGVQDVDPLSRTENRMYGNAIGDARKLAFLEILMGRDYQGTWCWGERDPNPHGPAAAKLLALYEKVKAQLEGALYAPAAQDDLDSLKLTWNEADQSFGWDVSDLVNQLRAEYTQDPPGALRHLKRLGAVIKAWGEGGYDILIALKAQGKTDGDSLSLALLEVGEEPLVFRGSAGQDLLVGNSANNDMDGLKGDDSLHGGEGDDTYRFQQGGGRDVVLDVGSNKGDVIRLGAGIEAAKVLLSRGTGTQIDDLIMDFGGGDQLVLQYYFYNASFRIEDIYFADGTHWRVGDVMAKTVQMGTADEDRIYGVVDQVNTIRGLDGNDTLVGGSLADSLDGGAGGDMPKLDAERTPAHPMVGPSVACNRKAQRLCAANNPHFYWAA